MRNSACKKEFKIYVTFPALTKEIINLAATRTQLLLKYGNEFEINTIMLPCKHEKMEFVG